MKPCSLLAILFSPRRGELSPRLRAPSVRAGVLSPRALSAEGRALPGRAHSLRSGELSMRGRSLRTSRAAPAQVIAPRGETGFSLARGPVAQGNQRVPRGGGYAKCAFFLRGISSAGQSSFLLAAESRSVLAERQCGESAHSSQR